MHNLIPTTPPPSHQQLEVLYRLSWFAHLFDVGVGINLAYTILEQVYSTSNKAYSDKLESLLKECAALVEPGSTTAAWNSYMFTMQKSKFEKRKKYAISFVRIIRILAIISAICLAIILGKIGFDPKYEVPGKYIWGIIILFIIPVPAGGLISLFIWKYWIRCVKNDLNEHKKMIIDARNDALDALERIR